MGINWDEIEQPGQYPDIQIKFKEPNTKAVGEITFIRTTDFGGTSEKVPELWIRQDDGVEVSVAASQVNLRRLLCQLRPEVGDRIAIVYTGDGKSSKAGQSPPKLFDVKVRKAGDAAPAAEPVAAPPPIERPTPSAVSADSLI